MTATPEEMDDGRYAEICDAWAAGQVQAWKLLRTTLSPRSGWWFAEPDESNGPMWCFGIDEAARLVVTVSYDMFHLYDADNDKDHNFFNTEMLRGWLEIHEGEHAGWTGLQSQIIVESLPAQIETWRAEQGE